MKHKIGLAHGSEAKAFEAAEANRHQPVTTDSHHKMSPSSRSLFRRPAIQELSRIVG